jgi:hypothetical protein
MIELMAVSKNTIVITSKGPKGERGSAVTADGTEILSFSTVSVTGSNDIDADEVNDTITVTGSGGTTVTSSGSTMTISSDQLSVKEEGVDVTTAASSINFTGSAVTASATDGDVTVNITGGGGGSAITVEDDGVSLTTDVSLLNFAGAGVVLSEPVDDQITVTISGNTGSNYLGFAAGGDTAYPAGADDVLNFVASNSSVSVAASDLTDTITITGGRLQDETTPILNGNLDVNGNDIASSSNGDIELAPDGTGNVIVKGNATGGSGKIVLNCEQNSHGVTIQGPPHSAAATYTLTLPNNDGDANQFLQTNGSGTLTWADGGSATTLDGQKLEYVVRSSAFASAGDHEGVVMKVGDAGNTLTAGTVYYFDATQTDWVAASNAAEGTAKGILGIALGTSGTADGVLIQGLYYYADAAGVTGDVLFLGTAGALTATAPTTDGEILRVLGQNIDDNIVMFQPSQDFVELGAAAGTTGLDDLSDAAVTTPAAGHLLIYDNTDSQFENATLTAGTNVSITNADASITINACDGTEIEFLTRDGAVGSAGQAEGTIVKFGTGTLVAGQVYTHASGAWVAVDADAQTTTEGLLGMALGTSPTTNGLLVHGVGYLSHDPGTAGDVLYISATAGQVTGTQPSTTGQFVRVAGYCLADNKVFFSPSQDFIEVG